MQVVRCKCTNISVHLKEEVGPTLEEETKLILEESKGVSSGPLVAATLGMGGVKVSVRALLSLRTLQKEWKSYRIASCLNCKTLIYAQKASEVGDILLNSSLQPRNPDTDNEVRNDPCYSPVWNIILVDEYNAENALLEAPDINDKESYQFFKELQTQLQEYLSKSEMEMQERIKEFTEMQYEIFRNLQAKSVRDRKVLWSIASQHRKTGRRLTGDLIIGENSQGQATPSIIPAPTPSSTPSSVPSSQPLKKRLSTLSQQREKDNLSSNLAISLSSGFTPAPTPGSTPAPSPASPFGVDAFNNMNFAEVTKLGTSTNSDSGSNDSNKNIASGNTSRVDNKSSNNSISNSGVSTISDISRTKSNLESSVSSQADSSSNALSSSANNATPVDRNLNESVDSIKNTPDSGKLSESLNEIILINAPPPSNPAPPPPVTKPGDTLNPQSFPTAPLPPGTANGRPDSPSHSIFSLDEDMLDEESEESLEEVENESQANGKGEEYDLDINGDEDNIKSTGESESEGENIKADEPSPPNYAYLATSLPITIPADNSKFSKEKERAAQAQKRRETRTSKVQSKSFVPAGHLLEDRQDDDEDDTDTEAKMELSKSFAVPMSRTKIMKGFL